MQNIVVVGASLAGISAAHTLRGLGFDAKLTIVGQETHAPYRRDLLSKQFLRKNMPAEQLTFQRYSEIDADWFLGHSATGLDMARQCVHLSNGYEIPYDGLVVATGARARRWPQPLDNSGPIHYLRALDDALRLQDALSRSSRVTVIGGGFIGNEVAAACRIKGLDVTIVDSRPLPLENELGDRAADTCVDLAACDGVNLRLGTEIRAISTTETGATVLLADNSVVESDIAVLDIGTVPNTEWLGEAALQRSDRILCDESGAVRQAPPGYVAAGDAAFWKSDASPELADQGRWISPERQGRIAARTLLGASHKHEHSFVGPDEFMRSDHYGYPIHSIGITDSREAQFELAEGVDGCRGFAGSFWCDGDTVGAVAIGNWPAFRGLVNKVRSGGDWLVSS